MMRPLTYTILGLALHAVLLALPLTGRLDRLLTDAAVPLFFALATLFCAADLTTLWYGDRRSPRPATPPDRMARWLAAATGATILCVFWIGLSDFAARSAPSPVAYTIAGATLMAVGSGLRFTAIRALGRSFVTEMAVPVERRLVQTGIYRHLRHPSETGLLAAALGASVLLRSPWAAAALLFVLLPLVLARVRFEDACLTEGLGAVHERYLKRTWRLVPFVY